MENKNLDDLFVEMARLVSVNNDIAARMMFYSIMGSYFKNVRISFGSKDKDLRLSMIWLQTSRSGKGQLMSVAKDLCDELNIRYCENTDFSTAGLVGSINQQKTEHNIKYGLSENNPISEDGKHAFQDPIDYGDIMNYDIIMVPEAKKAFSNRSYSEDLLTDLQPTLDRPGHVRKSLRTGAIEYQCSPTYILTTYQYDGLTKSISEQGFFQRCQFLLRNLSSEDISEMREQQDDLLNPNVKMKYQSIKKELVSRILKLHRLQSVRLTLSKSALILKKRLMSMFISRIQNEIFGDKFSIAMSFTQTVDDIIIKTAGLKCIWRNGKKIESYDIIPASMNISDWTYFSMATSVIEGLTLENKYLNRDMKIVVNTLKSMEHLNVTKTLLYERVKQELGYSYDKSRSLVNKMIQHNYIKIVKGERNTKYLKAR